MRVLVAEDDPGCSTLLEAIFRLQGFTTERVGDGAEALDRLRAGSYGAVVLDLMLPNVNGFEVIRDIKSFAPDLLDRVVVVTAASDSTLKHFDASQVSALIRKPFDLDELVAAVRVCAFPARNNLIH